MKKWLFILLGFLLYSINMYAQAQKISWNVWGGAGFAHSLSASWQAQGIHPQVGIGCLKKKAQEKWSLGLALQYGYQRFSKSLREDVSPTDYLPQGGIKQADTYLQSHTLDILFQTNYTLHEHWKLGMGIGPSLLLHGKTRDEIRFYSRDQSEQIDQASGNQRFSFLGRNRYDQPILIFTQLGDHYETIQTPRSKPAWLAYVEIFWNVGGSSISLGFREAFRQQPGIYEQENLNYLCSQFLVRVEL